MPEALSEKDQDKITKSTGHVVAKLVVAKRKSPAKGGGLCTIYQVEQARPLHL